MNTDNDSSTVGEASKTLADTSAKTCLLEYFCEMCDYYPLYPVHGHYECPQCFYKTKCCEGAPAE